MGNRILDGQQLLNIPPFDLSIWSIQEIPKMTLFVGINLSFWEIHAVFAVAITDILEVFKNLSKRKQRQSQFMKLKISNQEKQGFLVKSNVKN